MEEKEYTEALEAILKEMRINLNKKDSKLLIDNNGNYKHPPVRPYNFERPKQDKIVALTFIVEDDMTKEECEIENIHKFLKPLYKNVEISSISYPKLFLKQVKDLDSISTDKLYFVETKEGMKTSVVMLSKNDKILKIISLRADETDIEIHINDIDIIYEIIHCKF